MNSHAFRHRFLMKRVEVAADGKGHPQSQEARWQKWFVQLSGTIMSTWNAQEMEEAAREDRTVRFLFPQQVFFQLMHNHRIKQVPPQYLNLSDAFVHPSSPSPKDQSSPGKFQFTMNSAGLNRIIFCAPSPAALSMWINAIRLAGWERSRCNEIYTGTLLGTKEPAGGWAGYENGLMSSGKGNKFEGWLKARLPGDTEWRRVWTVVLKGTDSSESIVSVKKTNRMSLLSFGKKKETAVVIDDLPGGGALATVAFYSTNKLTKKEQPLCTLQHRSCSHLFVIVSLEYTDRGTSTVISVLRRSFVS
jgi:CCR4-NOT transcriptional complex subunit CAF120